MGALAEAFDRAVADAPAPAAQPRKGSLSDEFDAAAKEADKIKAAEQAAKETEAKKNAPIKLAEPPGKLLSAGAGAGEAVGRGALAVQQLLGKGAQTVGDILNPATSTLHGPAPEQNFLQQSGQWLLRDASEGVRKLARENAPYQEANPGSNLAGAVVGAVASPVNKLIPMGGAPASVAGAAAKGALQGAALNTLTSPVQDDKHFLLEKGQQAAVGGIGGALGGVAAYGLSKAIDKGVEAVRTLANKATSGNPAAAAETTLGAALAKNGVDAAAVKAERPELFAGLKTQVEDAIKAGKPVDPEALKRLVRAQTLPVPVPMLKGAITREPMQFAKEQNLSGIEGVGKPIVEVRQAANKAFFDNLDSLGAKRGTDIVSGGKEAIDVLRAADKVKQSGVTAAYDAFKKSTGRELEVPLPKLAEGYAKTLNEFGESIPGSIRKKFEDLENMPWNGRFTIEEAEGLIKSINRNYDPKNIVQSRALDELRRGVQKSISEGAGASAEGTAAAGLAKAARQAATERFALHEATPALRGALRGQDADKFIQQHVLQGNEREIASMMNVIKAQDPKAAASIQDALMAHIKYVVGSGRSGENAKFSSDALNKLTTNPNMSRRIGAVLGPEKMAVLRQLNKTVEDSLYDPLAAAVNRSHTTAAAANLVQSEIQGGSVNAIADLASKIAPILATPAKNIKESSQAARAAKMVNEAVNPSLGAQTGSSKVVDILSRNLRPDVQAQRAAAAALQERNRREARR